MPLYEMTLITRSLSRNDLFTTLKRAATLLLDHGAVIESFQSLGHKDLPYFLINSYMSIKTMNDVQKVLVNDKDLLYSHAVYNNLPEAKPEECNLAEMLQPPAYRQSVEDLRLNQRLGHFTRMKIFKRTEREWRSIPKSYTIAPPRK
ncbi:hypothetical protein M3Y98_01103200 [Aphelenchoides besseyi]|nr:hypothetical protein M3Y98_01103200 [Aphelenchoides besseyi]